ncbi:MAG: molybdopterin biosynthesis protein, partial [Bacillota bacterium]
SAMDGIAVKASETDGASQRRPVQLKENKQAFWVDTGDPIPEGFNAVIKVEEVNDLGGGTLEIEKAVTPWENVRTIGESVIKGQLLLTVNHEITPYDVGALLEAGILEIKVRKRPKVGIIPTGSEIVVPETTPEKGQHIEFNSAMMKSAARGWGAKINVSEIVDDDYHRLKEKLLTKISNNDITVIIAGSSAGQEDYTLKLIQELGQVIVHGINIMPGKPVILGVIEDKPVLGIPGYPLSALLDFQIFVRSLVYEFLGLTKPDRDQTRARVKRKVPSHIGLEEYLRVNLAQIDGDLIAVPRGRGSAAMESLLNADGVMPVSQQKEGLSPGDQNRVYLLKPRARLEKDLLFLGSHDLSLDILRNMIRQRNPDFSLNIQSVGSMAGLMALKRSECHLAGAHLLDSETGQYNLPFIRKYLGDKQMALITLVYRQQGLMVKPGNPLGLKKIEDLTKAGITFINRQRGAGTRILLDYWLAKQNLSPQQITGYQREEYTHIGAAAAVTNGSADTALGILAAARAMDLDFIPLVEERYDLMMPLSYLNDKRIRLLQEIISSHDFQKQVESLGGYRTDDSGQVIKVNGDN